MPFADIELAHRLEATEALACRQLAITRRKLFPDCGSEWMECAGTTVVFDGPGSPVTQTFGLGLFEPLTPRTLDTIEAFFRERNAPVQHEVCPLAGVLALDLLCSRGYRPCEIASVLCQPLPTPTSSSHRAAFEIAGIVPSQAALWSDINSRAWSHDHPEYLAFMQNLAAIVAASPASRCFLALCEGVPAAAATLTLNDGVALFAGAATLPEFRRRGLQSALLAERLRQAHAAGCDLAMMVAEAGGASQRNAERNGFRLAYTRIKWQLHEESPKGTPE